MITTGVIAIAMVVTIIADATGRVYYVAATGGAITKITITIIITVDIT